MKRYVLSTGEAESVRSGADGAVFYYVNSEFFFFFFFKERNGGRKRKTGVPPAANLPRCPPFGPEVSSATQEAV